MSAGEPLFLDVEDVLELHASQLEAFGGSAGLRDRGLLESAVAQPQASFGKRTEPHATNRTSWLRDRDQMLRHLDCAWERRRDRRVYGFLVVEGKDDGCVPRKWREYTERAVTADYLRNSLPHRDDATRAAIAAAFLGVTTWQRVSEQFGLATLED